MEVAGVYVCPYEVFMQWRFFRLNNLNAQWMSFEETLATDSLLDKMKLANLSE